MFLDHFNDTTRAVLDQDMCKHRRLRFPPDRQKQNRYPQFSHTANIIILSRCVIHSLQAASFRSPNETILKLEMHGKE